MAIELLLTYPCGGVTGELRNSAGIGTEMAVAYPHAGERERDQDYNVKKEHEGKT